jgi:hypothetical protein
LTTEAVFRRWRKSFGLRIITANLRLFTKELNGPAQLFGAAVSGK